jgi:hypothetical protein
VLEHLILLNHALEHVSDQQEEVGREGIALA